MHLPKYLLCTTKVMQYTLTQVPRYKLKQMLHVCHFKFREGFHSGLGLQSCLLALCPSIIFVWAQPILSPFHSCSQEKHTRMAENTAHEAMLWWCKGVRRYFTNFLFIPHTMICETNGDKSRAGMFGSIDCMHWKWKLCLVALQWAFQDKNKIKV